MFGATASNGSVNVAKSPPFALLDGNAQALQSPKSLYPLTIYAPTFQLQECRHPAIAIARMLAAKFMQSFRQSCLEAALAFLIPLT